MKCFQNGCIVLVLKWIKLILQVRQVSVEYKRNANSMITYMSHFYYLTFISYGLHLTKVEPNLKI